MDEIRLENLLADALRPVDPPQRMSDRLHDTFSAITDAAASDLSDWAEELTESELESLRDPRNWIRPVTALAAGGVATGALILVGFRRRSRFRG
jgi:glucose-6-phosphate dehydrogenase assembly protein OpcA